MRLLRIQPIIAVVKRHLLVQTKDPLNIVMIFFMTAYNSSLWGFFGLAISTSTLANSYIALSFTPLIGQALWFVIVRTANDTNKGLFEEMRSQNLAGMYTSPLTISEWGLALIIASIVRPAFLFLITCAFLYTFFHCNIFLFGWWLIPIFASLVMVGWSFGFLSIGLTLGFGSRIQSHIWATIWIFATLSGVFYSTSVLPVWAQKISTLLPMTYIFSAVHQYMLNGILPLQNLYISFTLNTVYLILTSIFLMKMIRKALEHGITKLEVDN